MDYKALFAAVKSEIEKRGLMATPFSRLCGDECGQVIYSWTVAGSIPTKPRLIKVFFEVIKRLEIDLSQFADMETVGGRVEFLRLSHKMTPTELADAIGCSRSTIGNIESNKSPIKNSITALVKVFAGSYDFILNGTKKEISHALKSLAPLDNQQIESPTSAGNPKRKSFYDIDGRAGSFIALGGSVPVIAWNGSNLRDVSSFISENCYGNSDKVGVSMTIESKLIIVINGKFKTVCVGDYIVANPVFLRDYSKIAVRFFERSAVAIEYDSLFFISKCDEPFEWLRLAIDYEK